MSSSVSVFLLSPIRRIQALSLPKVDGCAPLEAAMMGGPPRALHEGISKSIFQRRCQYLAINAHEMAPRTGQRLQERVWDTPT